jgi:hypothetical protein
MGVSIQLHAKTALPAEGSSWYTLNMMLGGSHSWFGRFGEEKDLLRRQECNHSS